MIRGLVAVNAEIRFPVEVRRLHGGFAAMDFVLDTGFTDFLTMSEEDLSLRAGVEDSETEVVFANGNSGILRVKWVEVLWHGQADWVKAYALPTALLGMNMLHGSRVCFDLTAGGAAEITPLEAA